MVHVLVVIIVNMSIYLLLSLTHQSYFIGMSILFSASVLIAVIVTSGKYRNNLIRTREKVKSTVIYTNCGLIKNVYTSHSTTSTATILPHQPSLESPEDFAL